MSGIGSLRVLLVDDDPFQLTLLSASLEGLGLADIHTACNGAQVIALLAAGERYDVILSDLNMPRLDGIELMRHLADRRYPGGVILLTGEHPKILQAAHSLAEAHNLRLLGVLRKPFQSRELFELLQQCLAVHLDGVRTEPITRISADELRKGMAAGQLIPHFQPQVAADSGRVVGVEALARWHHPVYGMIQPAHFIPQAERHGLIRELGQIMLSQAISQAAAWRAGGMDLDLAVNLTAEDIQDVGIADRVADMALDHGLPLSRLVLELTESQLMRKPSLALDTLIRLRLKGVTLAVDDFGTGYSNLGQIKRAPFGMLKIDRCFVRDAATDDEGRAILEASILMGRSLGLTVVAEGVEQPEEWHLARTLGAHQVQGFLIARPMPAESFPAWHEDWQAATASGRTLPWAATDGHETA